MIAKESADEAYQYAELAEQKADYATAQALDASALAKKSVQKVSGVKSSTIDMQVKELTNKEFQISAELIGPSPVPNTGIKLYNFVYDRGYTITYDKDVIPSVSVVTIKKPFPSKEISISVPYILDSFYPDSSKYLIVAVNLGKTTVKVDSKDTVVSKDLIQYVRISYDIKTPSKALFVDTDYVSFKFDPTVIFNNQALSNSNQELINITASSYSEAGYWNDYPNVTDDTNPGGTSWNKTYNVGIGGLMTLALQSTIVYDYRQTNAGDGVAQFKIDLQRNQFSNGFIKYILFKSNGTAAKPTNTLRVIINADTDKTIVSDKPYTVLGQNTFQFDFTVTTPDTGAKRYVGLVLYCHNNNILVSTTQF
ncbi:MAG: hypothetical protein PHC75_10255 [Burkholderiales bacterium]|nr:hypothetical protein [Burkholderiales bacterium]